MNDFALAGTVLTSPTAAFTELRERPRFLGAMSKNMLMWPSIIAIVVMAADICADIRLLSVR